MAALNQPSDIATIPQISDKLKQRIEADGQKQRALTDDDMAACDAAIDLACDVIWWQRRARVTALINEQIMSKPNVCPLCGGTGKRVMETAPLFRCGRCGGFFDDDPDEGGDLSNSPQRRMEQAERAEERRAEERRAERRRRRRRRRRR